MEKMGPDILKNALRVAEGLPAGYAKNRAISSLLAAQYMAGDAGDEAGALLGNLRKDAEHRDRSGMSVETLFNLADICLCIGDEKGAKMLSGRGIESADFSSPWDILYADNRAITVAARLQTATSLPGEALNFIRLKGRYTGKNEGFTAMLEFLAMTLCDCMHLSPPCFSYVPLVEEIIGEVPRKYDRDAIIGKASRKLCMRTETLPTDNRQLLGVARSFYTRIGDTLEKIFTLTRIAAAENMLLGPEYGARSYSKLGRMAGKGNDHMRLIRDLYAMQSYMITAENRKADEIRDRVLAEFRHNEDAFLDTRRVSEDMEKALGESPPPVLTHSMQDYARGLELDRSTIAQMLVLAGRLSGSKEYLEKGIEIARQLKDMDELMRIMLDISQAHAFTGNYSASAACLNEVLDFLEKKGKAAARATFQDDVVSALAENYFVSHARSEYVDLFMEANRFFAWKEDEHLASLKFCDAVSSLAKDMHYNLTFAYY